MSASAIAQQFRDAAASGSGGGIQIPVTLNGNARIFMNRDGKGFMATLQLENGISLGGFRAKLVEGKKPGTHRIQGRFSGSNQVAPGEWEFVCGVDAEKAPFDLRILADEKGGAKPDGSTYPDRKGIRLVDVRGNEYGAWLAVLLAAAIESGQAEIIEPSDDEDNPPADLEGAENL